MSDRGLVLWQIVSLFQSLAYARQWWATMEPETYGWWAADQATGEAEG